MKKARLALFLLSTLLAAQCPGAVTTMATKKYVDDKVTMLSNMIENVSGGGGITTNDVRAIVAVGWWSEWTVLRNGVDVTAEVGQPEWEGGIEAWDTDSACAAGDSFSTFGYAQSGQTSEDNDAIGWSARTDGGITEVLYTATRYRVAAPVPTKPEDIGAQAALTFDTTPTAGSVNPVTSGGVKTALDGKASTADATLAPVYSQTPTFSEWTIMRDGSNVTSQVTQPEWLPLDHMWVLNCLPSDEFDLPTSENIINYDAVELGWSALAQPEGGGDGYGVSYTATRTRTDIIGYTLGAQTNEVLAAANALTPLQGQVYDFSSMSNVIRAISDVVTALGGSVTNNPAPTVP